VTISRLNEKEAAVRKLVDR